MMLPCSSLTKITRDPLVFPLSERTKSRYLSNVSVLIAIYHILKEKVPYHDLGADYYSVINQEKIINRNIRSLEKLGVNVIIQPK